MKKLIGGLMGFTVIFLFCFAFQTFAQEAPALFFSDLASGPKIGWEGSNSKGTAVSIWGKNFGAARGNSYVTVNGAQLTQNSDYAEWAATGINNGVARSLERTTFWLNSSCQDGAGQITVTVNDVRSNSLPFTVRAGNIYFVAPNGSDTNDGKTTATPWKYLQKFITLKPGDTMYARAGEYTIDPASWTNLANKTHISFFNFSGTAGNEIALVGYPGETPFISGGNILVRMGLDYEAWSKDRGHFAFSKFKAMNGGPVMFYLGGADYVRIIGNIVQGLTNYGAVGIFNTDNSAYLYVYGNYIKDSGADNWMHWIYGKTKKDLYGGTGETERQYIAYNEIDGYIDWTGGGGHGCGGGMIDLSIETDAYPKTTHDIYIHSNLIKNSGGGIFFSEGSAPQYRVHDVYIYNNIIANSHECPSGYPATEIYTSYWDLTDTYVFNNLFYKSGGVNSGNLVTTIYTYPGPGIFPKFKNNIFITKSASQKYFIVDCAGCGVKLNSDHDAFYNAPRPSDSPYLITNPLTPAQHGFVDEANLDFRLTPSSSYIDAGIADSAILPYLSVDFDGNPRPQGAGIDLGPFEYAGTYIPSQPDTEAPTVPSNLTATAASSTQINLSWSASTDNVAVTGYRIYRGGAYLTSVATTSCQDKSLTAQTTYIYTILAFDSAGNVSAQSAQAQATTQKAPLAPAELIIDNTDAAFTTTGTWWVSGYPNPYGTNSLASYTNRTTQATYNTAAWTPNIPKAGTYKVYAWWTAGAGRANDAKYTVTHSSGQDTITANQKLNGGLWNLLGTYTFGPGAQYNISLSNLSTDPGYIANQASDSVCADAVRFVEVEQGLKGDVNCNGTVDVVDVQALVNCILGKGPCDLGCGNSTDANDDGSVDVLDVQEVVNIILGG
jgi:chitodextrinase